MIVLQYHFINSIVFLLYSMQLFFYIIANIFIANVVILWYVVDDDDDDVVAEWMRRGS